jgi:alpha-tubulin suppressor-like RCC1 family protein
VTTGLIGLGHDMRRAAAGVLVAATAGLGPAMVAAPSLAAARPTAAHPAAAHSARAHFTATHSAAAHPTAARPIGSIAAGGFHSCTIQAGQAYCWGANFEGELGNGSNLSARIPAPVRTTGALAGQTLTQISNGVASTCGLDAAGRAYCWGDNGYGELGDGTTDDSTVPVPVHGLGAAGGQTLTEISVGNGLTCGVDRTGQAYCWGQGSLGDGGTESSDVPVGVNTGGALAGKSLTQVSVGYEIATGGGFACALDAAGQAYCWGDNSVGELGNGSARRSRVPVKVAAGGALAGRSLTQIAAGDGFSCGLDTTGQAFCWGDNSAGELGNGAAAGSSSVPVAVSTSGALAGKTLTHISAGSDDACAIDTGGKAYCWGADGDDELGNGETSNSRVPAAVFAGGALAGTTLTQISTGGYHSCALDTAGAVICWGDNNFGELGDNSVTLRAEPALAGPHAPTSVRATPGQTTAAVSWTASADLDGAALTGYTAIAEPGGLTCGTAHLTHCAIKGLTGGTTYAITVVARTTAGRSGASAPATVTPGRR